MPIVRYTSQELRRMESRTDWAKVDATTEEDIARHIAEDPDAAPPAEGSRGRVFRRPRAAPR